MGVETYFLTQKTMNEAARKYEPGEEIPAASVHDVVFSTNEVVGLVLTNGQEVEAEALIEPDKTRYKLRVVTSFEGMGQD